MRLKVTVSMTATMAAREDNPQITANPFLRGTAAVELVRTRADNGDGNERPMLTGIADLQSQGRDGIPARFHIARSPCITAIPPPFLFQNRGYVRLRRVEMHDVSTYRGKQTRSPRTPGYNYADGYVCAACDAEGSEVSHVVIRWDCEQNP